MKDIHILFRVPEGLEFIAAKDIKDAIVNSTIVRDPAYSWDNKTGHVHLFCSVKNIKDFKSHIQSIKLLSVYSVMLIASEAIIPTPIFKETDSTCQFISKVTKEGDWKSLIDEDSSKTFRATFKKGSIKHQVPSQEIAGYIGAAFGDQYSHWKVKMTEFDYEIMSVWFHSSDDILLNRLSAKESGIILLVGLNIPIKDQKHRNRVFFGPTSLNPSIAYCLTMLADPQPGQIIFDICCGTGTIPIEVKSKTLTEKARGNLSHTDLDNAELLLSDSRKLCFRDGIVDTIVSDWPWGLRENSFQQIQGLYPKFIKQMYRILKNEGKAYIVTQGQKLMNTVLRYDWCKKQWLVNDIIPIGIGGYEVYLYILSKRT
ncbi:hypothetical protein G6F60_004208 [Rhizopus arrhizus]|nr:hypothetical protein G6F66_001734 [Rhizopus arrhizus]KAG1404604.1 hypothetical protein G6F60_004208 [Rhizopus arrhizus]